MNHVRVTLNNIKVAPVSDALLAQQNHDLDPSIVEEAMRRHDWLKRKAAMDDELESFRSWRFGSMPSYHRNRI